MDLVCDTNVWYHIAFGELDPTTLKEKGCRLLFAPTSLMELGSNFYKSNFDKLKKVAIAISQHADEFLLDTERHLANIWNLDVEELDIDFNKTCDIIGKASSADELERGIVDCEDEVIRRLFSQRIDEWRSSHYTDFEKKVWDAIDAFFPGYRDARQQGDMKQLDSSEAKRFRTILDSVDYHCAMLKTTYLRAGLHLEGVQPPTLTQDIRRIADAKLTPYIKIYGEYLLEVATKCKPCPNDLGDLEFFLYAQEGRKVFVDEKKKRWHAIADAAGCGDCVFRMSEII